MFRRTHLHPNEALPMLHAKGLQKYAAVVTVDDEELGQALRVVYRPDGDVNADLKLYRGYLVVQSIELGGPTYIPTLFIADYDVVANKVRLSAELETVQEELWNREPDFVARGHATVEELPLAPLETAA